MYIVAHRGAEDLAPENTLSAFRAIGPADALELDVHTTADQAVVVLHDRTAARVAAADSPHRETPVAALTLEQVREIRLRDGEKVPTLVEVLEATTVPVQVEIKAPGAVPALATLLRRHPEQAHRMLFISFIDAALVELCDRVPDCRVGVLRAEVGADLRVFDHLPSHNLAAYLPSRKALELDLIDTLQARGIRLGCWTVRDEHALALAERAGVDFCTVSDPLRLRPSHPSTAALVW